MNDMVSTHINTRLLTIDEEQPLNNTTLQTNQLQHNNHTDCYHLLPEHNLLDNNQLDNNNLLDNNHLDNNNLLENNQLDDNNLLDNNNQLDGNYLETHFKNNKNTEIQKHINTINQDLDFIYSRINILEQMEQKYTQKYTQKSPIVVHQPEKCKLCCYKCLIM